MLLFLIKSSPNQMPLFSVDSLAKLWLQCEFSKSVDLSAASKSEATVGSNNTFSNNKS